MNCTYLIFYQNFQCITWVGTVTEIIPYCIKNQIFVLKICEISMLNIYIYIYDNFDNVMQFLCLAKFDNHANLFYIIIFIYNSMVNYHGVRRFEP